MSTTSLLDPHTWHPVFMRDTPDYAVGHACGMLAKAGAAEPVTHYLSGRLYVSKSGWLLLSVPNALIRGVFDAMTVPGAELPRAGTMNIDHPRPELLNAHISVMNKDEVARIGADKITERGHHFKYSLGPVKEIQPRSSELSRVWAIQVSAPELSALRKSYGLSPLLNDDHQFHITVAVRRTNVLRDNDISKFDTAEGRGELKAAAELLRGGEGDGKPDAAFTPQSLTEGTAHEREHTDQDQVAKEIAKDHLSEDPAYYKKLKEVEKAGNAPSIYLDEFKQRVDPFQVRTPIPYDHNRPVFENIQNQLAEVKQRGDFRIRALRNDRIWRASLDPQYRYNLSLEAMRGTGPRPSRIDQILERYGDQMLSTMPGGSK